jgi:hypothetical protein
LHRSPAWHPERTGLSRLLPQYPSLLSLRWGST